DAAQVHGRCADVRPPAGRGQGRVLTALVELAGAALEEAALLETIEQPAEPALRQEDELGELAQAELALGAAEQLVQHAVARDRQPVRLEICLERSRQRRVGDHERAEREDLLEAEPALRLRARYHRGAHGAWCGR